MIAPTLTITDHGVRLTLQQLPRNLRQGVASALTKTMQQAQTAANRQVAQEWAIPVREMGRQTKVMAATPERLSARLIASTSRKERQGRIPLSSFRLLSAARSRVPTSGVRVQVERGKPALVLRHAFVVTFASGHTAVVERVYGRGGQRLPGKGWFKGGPPKRGKTIYYGEKGIARAALPIVEVFGPSVLHMYRRPSVFQVIQAKIGEVYRRLVTHEVGYYLGRRK